MYDDVYNCGYVNAEYGRLHCTQCDMDGMQRIVQRVPGGYIVEGMTGDTDNSGTDLDKIMRTFSSDIAGKINSINQVIIGLIGDAILSSTKKCQSVTLMKTEFIFNTDKCVIDPTLSNAIAYDFNGSALDPKNDLHMVLDNLLPGFAPTGASKDNQGTPSNDPDLFGQLQKAVFDFTNKNADIIVNGGTDPNGQPVKGIIQSQTDQVVNSQGGRSNGITRSNLGIVIWNKLKKDTDYVTAITKLTMTKQSQPSTGLSWWVWLLIAIGILIVIIIVLWRLGVFGWIKRKISRTPSGPTYALKTETPTNP